MKGYKQVWIPEPIHRRIKTECKTRRPRVNMTDRVAQLVENGYRLESVMGETVRSESSDTAKGEN